MTKTIYMGQFETVRKPDILRTTLGSCVGVVLYDPLTQVYGMAHIMLPSSTTGTGDVTGKYADTALPALIEKMGVPLAQAARLKAKIAGGANMFSTLHQWGEKDILQIGERNITATLERISHLGIAILGKVVGGTEGRELTIDTRSGKVWIRTIGERPVEL